MDGGVRGQENAIEKGSFEGWLAKPGLEDHTLKCQAEWCVVSDSEPYVEAGDGAGENAVDRGVASEIN